MPAGAPPRGNAGVQGHHRTLRVEKGYIQRVLHSSHVDGSAGSQQQTLPGPERRPPKQPTEPLPPPFGYGDTVTQFLTIRWIVNSHRSHWTPLSV
jgi:hypothetical protein